MRLRRYIRQPHEIIGSKAGFALSALGHVYHAGFVSQYMATVRNVIAALHKQCSRTEGLIS
jgi:hypothetical protein